jgi:hypothetical protein
MDAAGRPVSHHEAIASLGAVEVIQEIILEVIELYQNVENYPHKAGLQYKTEQPAEQRPGHGARARPLKCALVGRGS